MRTSLMALVTLSGFFVGAVAFAASAQAGDAASESAAIDYDGGCGFSSAHLQAQIDAGEQAEKAAVRAKLETLVDNALGARETAAAPAATPVSGQGG